MKKYNIFSNLYMLLMILFLFEPNIFVKYSSINYLYIGGAVLSLITIILLLIKKSIKPKKPIIFVIIWKLIALFTTIIYSGDILKCGYQSVVLITLVLYAEYFYETKRIDVFLGKLNTIFNVYLTINFITYLLYPTGIYAEAHNLYFLGIRTRFTEYAFAAIVTAISCYKCKKISKFSLVYTIIVCVLNIILPNIGTAYVGIIIALLSYIILNGIFLKKKNTKFGRYIVLGSLIATILIVFFRIQDIFSVIIVNLLHKDLTLTERTLIWDRTIPIIKSSHYILGNGYSNDGNFVLFGNGLWQAHNQLLQLLYEVGFIGTFAFYNYILASFSITKKNTKYMNLIIAFAVAILIMMITEIYSYYLPTFVIFIILYYREAFDNISEYKGEMKND